MVEIQNKDRRMFYPVKPDAEVTVELNKFYSWFDIYNFKDGLSNFENGPAGCKIDNHLCVNFLVMSKRGKILVLVALWENYLVLCPATV